MNEYKITVKKALLFVPVLGIPLMIIYGAKIIEPYGLAFFASAIVQGISYVALLILIFTLCK